MDDEYSFNPAIPYKPDIIIDSGAFTIFKLKTLQPKPVHMWTPERLKLIASSRKLLRPEELLAKVNELPGTKITMSPLKFQGRTWYLNYWLAMPTEIDIGKYCDFLHLLLDRVTGYFNLDRINLKDREAAAAESRQNYLAMRKRGLHPIPVFHQGEDIKWLYQMVEDGADYIALAGASSLHNNSKERQWYDQVWNGLVNKGGFPAVKVHGLGDTKSFSLTTYPWYSVDSSSWARYAGAKAWIHMLGDDGRRLIMSVRRDGKSEGAIKDVGSFNGEEREVLRHRLAKYDVDLDRLLERRTRDHVLRLLMVAVYYEEYQKRMAMRPTPRVLPPGGFFADRPPQALADAPALQIDGPRIYLSSWMSSEFNYIFQRVQYPYILMSYAYLGGIPLVSKLRIGKQLLGEPYASRLPEKRARPVPQDQRPKQSRNRLPRRTHRAGKDDRADSQRVD